MKKALALILSLALIMSALVFPGAALVSAETVDTAEAELTFSDAITVLSEDINPRAIRTKVLSDGTVAAVYYRSGNGIYYATSDNGGVTFSEGVKLIGNATDSVLAATEIAEGETASTQVALAKEYVATYGEYGRGRLEAQNPNLIELKNGDIAAFYRYNTFETDPTNKPWSIYYASICYQILDKETGVWGDVQVMYECTEENVVADSGSSYGVWEPDPVYIGDELFCYFADTDLPGNVSYQHIMYCVYDEETGKFGEPAIAQNGIEHNSRDGMSVVTKLSDGTYAMVFESTNTSQSNAEDYITFVIKMSFSSDGKNWSDPVIVAKPEPLETSSTASIEYGVCAAPYVVTLPDGRLAVSYQTTDRYTGRIPNRVSYRIGTQVAISSQAITSETFANNEINDDVTSYFATEVNPGVLGENEFSKSASLMVKDDKLYVYYSVGNNIWTTTDGVETEKHNFGDVKMAYMDFSVEETLDANSRDNYVVYHSGGKDVTVNDDGSFSFVAGTTNMLYGEEYRASEPAEFDVDISYDAADYTTKGQSGYGFSADSTAKTISFTAGKQAKAQFDYVADAKMFDIDVTMQGNAVGTIWGGVAFHTQESDFASAVFNTAGYSVYLVRSSSSLNKLTLYVRYCTEGGVNANTYQPVLTTKLPTDIDLKLRLQVSVGETTFEVKALSEDGKTQYGETMTYNLDDTAAQSATKYYETGRINLITNGVHTFSNISITRTTQEVDISYNANNYTTNGQSGYAFSADAENKTLSFTEGKQAKAMLNYVKSADIPDIDVTMQGNAVGTIWGGVAFHVQESDFASAVFNTAGYSVYLVRSSSSLNKLTLYVRYCTEGGVNANTYQPVLTTELPTDIDLKLRLQVSVGEKTFEVKALSEDGKTQYGETMTYNLDDTAAQSKTKYYETGKIALIVNGVHTFSNISITNKTPIVKYGNIEKTADLDAHAVIDFPASVDEDNQVGMSFRVQQAADTSPGLTGYVIKLLQTTEETNVLNVQMTRYGTNSAGEINKNLGNMYTEPDTTVLGTGKAVRSSIILDAKVRDNIVTLTLTNAADSALTSTYTFDLTKSSTYDGVTYDDYYAEGGFGFFKNGNATEINISDIEFTKVAKNVNHITDSSIYTVYRPELSEEVTFEDNAIVNNDATTKKIMLNDTLVSDFKADTTLEIGYDGNLKGGIIFRAQNVGGENDEMEGYSAVVFKNHNNTGNYGRMVLLVYKWARLADGSMSYMGTVGSKVFADTLNSVYPDAKNSMLASAGVKVRLNLEVEGDTVVTSFDVFDKNNAVAASSDEITVDLNNSSLGGVDSKKVFAEDAATTVYNAGEIGLSISTLGKICDFNLEYDELGLNDTDVTDYTVYSSNANTMDIDDVNDKIVSNTVGHKQAVLSGRNAKDFDVTATLKSTSAGATYNFGYDFGIKESTHSKTCDAGGSTTYMFEGYRVQLTRTNATGGDLSFANLRLYKFERVDNGDGTYSNKRTELANVPNADFFADYDETGYGNVEVVLNVKFEDGVLSANAYVKDYPTRTLSYTYTDEAIVNAEGTIGWYIENGGSVTMNNIKLGFTGQMITAADCTNGSVYAAINSGAATVGDDVKIVPVAKDGYRIDTAYANATEVKETENGYVFQKAYGDTEISATFFLVGDIDSNDKVDGVDITCMRKELLGLDEYNAKYTDINDDDATNLKDLVRIKKIAAGIE